MNEREMKEPVNMKVSVAKGKLVITADLNDFMEKAVKSESGKSYILASSRGNQSITAQGFEDIKWGANIYIPAKRFEELQRIAELEAKGGSEATGLPSQADAKEIARKDAELKDVKDQLAQTQNAMAQMQEMMAQMMAMQQANMAVATEPQQLGIDIKEVAPKKKNANVDIKEVKPSKAKTSK